uniref:Uncharacterized protein n=2 Tax=Meloidogyne TaxID=189290 RepID=A0A6V7VJG2_MELEN|nr:unnamed protein product [Meloidogyne enterolobii]
MSLQLMTCTWSSDRYGPDKQEKFFSMFSIRESTTCAIKKEIFTLILSKKLSNTKSNHLFPKDYTLSSKKTPLKSTIIIYLLFSLFQIFQFNMFNI